jgi:hypothetical protein
VLCRRFQTIKMCAKKNSRVYIRHPDNKDKDNDCYVENMAFEEFVLKWTWNAPSNFAPRQPNTRRI